METSKYFKTFKCIDNMVYRLYFLTEKASKIVGEDT